VRESLAWPWNVLLKVQTDGGSLIMFLM
jgi:hypothetical protein